MPFAHNGDVRVYYEVEGSGPPLVLQHGFSDSLETCREFGYVDALAHHQVILVDARGHGRSDKPHEPDAYRMTEMAGDVVAVLDELGIDRTHFYGHSMGGRIAFGLATYAPTRLLSLLIGAAQPFSYPERVANFITFLEKGSAGFVEAWEMEADISPALKARLLANDMYALIAYQKCPRSDEGIELAESLLRLDCPYKLIAGDQDALAPYSELEKYAVRLPDGALVTLPGIKHLECFQRIDLVLPHLRQLTGDTC